MPMTRCLGKPLTCLATCTMASSGFDTMIKWQSGEWRTMFDTTVPTIFALVCSKSSRLMPGLRGMPAVTTTTSEPAVSA